MYHAAHCPSCDVLTTHHRSRSAPLSPPPRSSATLEPDLLQRQARDPTQQCLVVYSWSLLAVAALFPLLLLRR